MTDPAVDRLASALGDRYAIERALGAGGMAVVYLARDLRHQRAVAIKVLRPELAAAVGPERFLKEIQLTANLQHPHILPLYDSGEAAGQLYYVMPFVEGQSLGVRLSSGPPLSIGEVLQILGDVAQALQYAHQRGVVHRDIKPDNVLLSGGIAVITDFGIAKAIAASRAAASNDALTSAGMSLGTPAYMAPEQVAADPAVDHRADIYAFGCLAYELLAGRAPFEGRSPQGILASHLSEMPRPVRELRPDTPPALGVLVTRCLEKEPTARPQQAADLVAGLESAGIPTLPPLLLGGPAAFQRALVIYVLAVAVVAVAANAATRLIGLPDWVFPGALAVMALGLPIILFTGYAQYVVRRALTPTPVLTPRGTRQPQGPMASLALKAGPHLSWKRATRGGFVALGAFVLLTAGYMGARAWGIGPAATLLSKGTLRPKEKLLVTDFRISGADSSIGPAIALATRVALTQSPAVTIVSTDEIAGALERMRRPRTALVDLPLGREIASRDGIRALVDGHVIRTGTKFDVGLRLVAADSGTDIVALHASARTVDAVIPTLDGLARKLRAKIGESLKSVRASPPLPRLTTRSMEALRLYAANLHTTDWRLAVRLMEQAVKADSEFAEGWRRLFAVYGNAGIRGARPQSAIVKAYRYSGNLPERERLLIAASYFSSLGDRARSVETLERLIALGDSNRAPINLAELLWRRREFARAESLDQSYLKRNPRFTYSIYVNLAQRQIELGKLDEAEATLDLGLSRFPNVSVIQAVKLRRRYHLGEFDAYQRALDSARVLPNLETRRLLTLNRRNLALLRGRLVEWKRLHDEAEMLNSAAGVQEREVPTAAPVLAALENAMIDLWIRNDTSGAITNLQKAAQEHPPERQQLLFLGEFLASAGRADLARDYLNRFEASADTGARRAAQHAVHRLRGAVALAQRQFPQAIDEIRRGDLRPDGPADACHICLPLALGYAFDRAGRPDSAIAMFEQYVNRPYSLRLSHQIDPVNLARVLRRLGELHDSLGNREKARDNYSRFVDLWEKADPELQPQVKAVRRRLVELSAEPVGQRRSPPPRKP